MVQGASFYPDQNLIFTRLGVGDVFVAENLRTAKFMYTDRLHERSLLPSNPDMQTLRSSGAHSSNTATSGADVVVVVSKQVLCQASEPAPRYPTGWPCTSYSY